FEQEKNSILKYATVQIDIGHELRQKWIAGERQGEGIRMEADSLISVLSDKAWIGNILLAAEEFHSIEVHVNLLSEASLPTDGKSFLFDLIQHDDTLIVGGERFEVILNNDETQERTSKNLSLTSIVSTNIVPANPTISDMV